MHHDRTGDSVTPIKTTGQTQAWLVNTKKPNSAIICSQSEVPALKLKQIEQSEAIFKLLNVVCMTTLLCKVTVILHLQKCEKPDKMESAYGRDLGIMLT